MAIISFTNYKRGQTTGCMSAVMRYTMQDKKTEFEGQQLVTGINCQPESVYADFMTTKRLYHKTDGVLFYHMVQSFPKGEAVDPVTAHAAALKLAEYYEGYEVLVCTHTDREHIHSHFLINSVNFDTGRKLHIAKEQLQELRQRNDMVCKEFSLPVFQPREQKQKTKTMTIGEYVDLRRLAIRHPEDVPLARSQRLRYLRLSRHLRIELNHRRSYRRTCLLHRAAARCHSYHPRNHLNYIVNEEGLFLLQFGVRSKPSFFVAQKPEYLLAMRRRKGVFKHETHDSR